MRTASCVFTVVVCLLAARSAPAQSSSATLGGTVLDESAAVVPGVDLTVLNVATGLERQAATGRDGTFSVPALPPGRYLLRAMRQGFAALEVPDIVLNVNDRVLLQLRLKVEQIGESLTVTASPSRISS